MALINCPECNKEISDQAYLCPNCGYNVKNYIRELKRAQYEQQAFEKLQSEMDIKIKQIENSKPIDKPKEPSLFEYIFFENNKLSIVSWLLLIEIPMFFLCYAGGFFIFLFVVILILGVPFFALMSYSDYKSAVFRYDKLYEEWYEQDSDWESYKEKEKAKIEQEYHEKASRMINCNIWTQPAPNTSLFYPQNSTHSQYKKPICPICNSINIKRISTLNRAGSIAMVGLASGKIGKQYQCDDCKHMW